MASNLALPLSALATGPILARALEPTGRGEMAAVLAPIALVVLMVNFGLPEALTYHVATRRLSVAAAARLGLVLGAVSGVVAAGVVALLTPLVLADYEHLQGLELALAATLPVLMGVTMWRWVAQGAGRFELPNRERWLSVVSRLLLLAALAVAGVLGVTEAAWITHGTSLAATVALAPIALLAFRRASAERASRAARRAVVRYGLRTWTGTLGSIVLLRLDQVLIAPLAGTRQLGFYAVAAAVGELPSAAFGAVRDVMLATSAERAEPRLAARATRAVIVVLLPVVALGVLAAPAVVPLLFGEDFSDSVPVARLLLVAALASAVDVVLGAGLLAAGRPGIRSLAQIVAAVVLVVGLVVLAPAEGAVGAAAAVLIARVVGAVLTVAAAVRTIGVTPAECFVPTVADARDVAHRLRGVLRRR
jgi:O-antigen/teichoic acid export membrane protein